MNFNMDSLRGYFSEDEAKIAFGVWGGIFTTDLAADYLYNAVFAKNKTQASSGAKLLLTQILIKGIVGTGLYAIGKENVFLRYMALGSMVSIIDSIAQYFINRNKTVSQAINRVAVQVV